MIGIISEYKYTKNELINLRKQNCLINYLMLPQFYSNYSAELEKANDLIIKKCSAIIFRIENFYAGTKAAIEKALFFKKKCKLIYEGQEYILSSLDDWKSSTGYGKDAVTTKHYLLQLYEDQRREHFYAIQDAKEKERYALALENVNEDVNEVYRFVNEFKYLYDLDVNMNDTADVYTAYKSLKFYLENNIEYSNEPQGEDFPYEIISFGDENYMEDYIYKCL